MSIIGKVDSLWRYPVKSMAGEALREAFVGFAGIYGDRIFAFKSAAKSKRFPYLTARDHGAIIGWRAQFRHPEQAAQPPNWAEASTGPTGLTPLYAKPAEMGVDVMLPSGATFAIDDPALLDQLRTEPDDTAELTLLYSERALTDCRPVSLFSLQTVAQLGAEIGEPLDARRFRANIYADLPAMLGFAEDGLVGRSLRIGEKTVLTIMGRDGRCVMITLDPDSGKSNPQVLRTVAQAHEGMAGVYCVVLVEGMIKPGDAIELLD